MAEFRERPYAQFNYLVKIGNAEGNDAKGGFAEVTGLGVEIDVIEYRNGNEKRNAVRKLPGMATYTNVVLKRGVLGSTDLVEWIREAIDGSHDVQRPVIIELLSEDRTTVAMTWKLTNAWPCKWSGADLVATGKDVAIETLELCHEGLTVE